MRTRFAFLGTAVLGILAYSVAADARSIANARHPLSIRLDTVLAELSSHDVGGLSATQLARRERLLETLGTYRDIGEFPNNYDFPGERVPYFVDRKTGVRCAVAYLLESTGRGDIVRRVASTDNNVWVAELAGDREFTTWLDENGLTLDEAARIQVPYMGDFPPEPVAARSTSSHRAYNVGSAAVVGASAMAALWSSRSTGRLSRMSALSSGIVTVGLGAYGLAGRDQTVGSLNLMAGSAVAYLATRAVLRDRRLADAQKKEQRVTVAPTVSATEGAGLSVAFRF